MMAAFISADASARKARILRFMDESGAKQFIYICPKAIGWQAGEIAKRACMVPFERIEGRDEWLTLNAMVGETTALIVENVTRYPKITSNKVGHLQRLSQQVGHRMLADIVPFTLSIEYVYTPYSYLDRSILGFPHWYAFREGFDEVDDDGVVRNSLDPSLIATKLAVVTDLGASSLLADRRQIDVVSAPDEARRYEAKKAAVFADFVSPTRAVTQLADFAHAFKSRRAAVIDASRAMARPLVLTNLASYATKLAPHIGNGTATSFALAATRTDIGSFSDIVYAESPITKSYLLMDIESQAPRDATVTTVVSDAKVDTFLRGRFANEVAQITTLIAALQEVRRAA